MLKKILFIVFGIFLIVFTAAVLLWPREKNQNLLEINFGKGGNVAEYKIDGFSWPEPDLKWTDSQIASVELPVLQVPEGQSLMVALDVIPFVTDKRKTQNVDVLVNDKLVKELVMDKPAVYKFVLPQMSDSEKIVLKFKFSNLKSPKELKLYDDARKLGFAIKTLIVSPIDSRNIEQYQTYKIGKEITFKIGGNSEKYIGTGWSGSEQKFTWTDGNDAYVMMFIKDTYDKKLQLNLLGHCIFDSEKSENQKITVYANNTELTTWDCKREETVYHAVLPQEIIENGLLKIRFNINEPFSPGADTRRLGLSVKSIDLSKLSTSKMKIKIALWLKKLLKVPENPTTEETK